MLTMKHEITAIQPVVVFLQIVLMLSAIAHADASRPNVILILTDDLGWGDLGVLGHPYAQTPNLDRLAKGGTVFNHFYAASSVCSPTRVAFQTGQYPARHSIHTAFGGLLTTPQDPAELSNLAAKYPEKVRTMKNKLMAWKATLPEEPAVSPYVHDSGSTP